MFGGLSRQAGCIRPVVFGLTLLCFPSDFVLVLSLSLIMVLSMSPILAA